MSYSTGEVPVLGDRVQTGSKQFGTVVMVTKPDSIPGELIGIIFDDGKRDFPLAASELKLISRDDEIQGMAAS